MSTFSNSANIAIVTGGSRGLGRSTAINLAKRGVNVIFTYNSNAAEAEKTLAEITALGRKAKALLLDAGAVSTFGAFADSLRKVLAEDFGSDHFDYLVNNAGTSLHATFAETTEEQFDAVLNVHFKGVFFLTQTLLPLIADGGRIVNISSGLTRFSYPGSAAYAAMKGAVEVLTRYLAKELGPRGIAVNTVAPGAIATDFSGGMVRDNPQVNQMVASVTALARVGEPEDIGPMVAALLMPENRWVNGQRIEVSGGMQL